MTTTEYGEWVRQHIQATGADAERLGALLWANREIITNRWAATYAELCECSQRLIEAGKVPQFPAEHPNALHRELKAYRAERGREASTERNVIPMGGRLNGCDCPNCNGGEILPSYEAATARLGAYVKKHQGLTGGIGLGGGM